jgi:short-subunit dehydrogenase
MKERSSAIVTGASSGIGKAIALMLVEEGYEVYGVARHFAEEVSFNKIIADVTDTDSISKVFSEVKEISVLVNCAGTASYGLAEDISPEDIRKMVRTNLEAPIILSGLALKAMKRQKYGHIINVSSVVSEKASTYAACYAATKAGLSSFSASVFEEARKHNIRVTDICPDMTKTGLYADADFETDDDPEAYLFPEDIASCVKDALNMRDGTCITKLFVKPRYHRVKRKSVLLKDN